VRTDCRAAARTRLPEGWYCNAHAQKLADRLAHDLVLDRDANVCQRCGDKSRGCQWAHVLARRVAPYLRLDPDNALALCAACHGEFTLHPTRFGEWLDAERPGLRLRLQERERVMERRAVVPGLAQQIADLRDMLGIGPPAQQEGML
jgi:5-methylcytosine-specific restriction endonuclease McrA